MPRPSLIIENRKMLYYGKILKSEGIDEQRTGLGISKECDICRFYFFKNRNFLYQPYVCNGCHDISLRAIKLTDIKIITVKGVHYRVVSNKTYDECYRLFESNSSTDKLGSL